VPFGGVTKFRREDEEGGDSRKVYTLEFKQETIRLAGSGQRVCEAADSLRMWNATLPPKSVEVVEIAARFHPPKRVRDHRLNPSAYGVRILRARPPTVIARTN
jgi:hypothetical protein